MGVLETLILYLLIGVVLASTMWMVHNPSSRGAAVGQLTTWIILWPFFAPELLGKAVSRESTPSVERVRQSGANTRLHEAQHRLLHAIGSLNGLAEGVLKPQLAQIDAMLKSLDIADTRLSEMEELLRTQEFDMTRVDAALNELRVKGYDESEPRVRSLHARQRNIERLRSMRDRTREELERALVKIEEISSQVLLLRFADQPEVKLAGLLTHVAADVENLSTVVLEMSEI